MQYRYSNYLHFQVSILESFRLFDPSLKSLNLKEMWMVGIHLKIVDGWGEREREQPSLLSLQLWDSCLFHFAASARALSREGDGHLFSGWRKGFVIFFFKFISFLPPPQCQETSSMYAFGLIKCFLCSATCTASVAGAKAELPVQACLYLSAPVSELNPATTLGSVFRLLKGHF